jgi:chromosome partitioning protein
VTSLRITAIVNSKGGTGKTTTAVNLATSAALAGQRVLLVDLDKQGSATQWLDHSPDNDDLMTALIDGVSLDPLVVATPVEGLDLVPASITLAQTERLTAEPGHQFSLRDCLAKTTPRDWVFLDAPGDLGPLTITALATATDVLVPVPAGALELDEVPKVRATIEKVRDRLNPGLRIAGVLLTQVRIYGRHASVLSREVDAELRVDFSEGDVLDAVIRDDNRFREAPAWRKPMALFDPDGKGDRDYQAVLAELISREAANVPA